MNNEEKKEEKKERKAYTYTAKMVKCPICGKEVQDRGLKGHLRFRHQFSGEKLEKEFSGVFEREERRSLMEKISLLHNKLREVRKRLEEVEKEDKGGFFYDDEVIEKLRRLYEKEEEDIQRQIDILLKEAGIDEDDDWTGPLAF